MSRITIAAAGTGKTTSIARSIATSPDRRALVVTYTVNGTRELERAVVNERGFLPSNVTIMTWFSFLMEHLIRPYQLLSGNYRIRKFEFNRPPNFKIKESSRAYYFTRDLLLYTDKASQFALKCAINSEMKSFNRLGKIFEDVYVDECQDLGGWDWNLVESMLVSGLNIHLVGDPRQSTFKTNYSTKNKNLKGVGLMALFEEWRDRNLCTIESLTDCYRSNQSICDVSNMVFPKMDKVISKNVTSTGHDGVFLVRPDDFSAYFQKFSPAILRHDKRANCFGLEHVAINWGLSKGLSYDRVAIIPTKTVEKHLQIGFDKLESPYSFYVALTRARYSVAIITDSEETHPGVVKYKPD
ncbi:MAG: hypothetical protein EOP06_01890 [Proteobacteria bacterium]|nr:MAG: hypothetical protein EOP06_01890 [Pseudomonadota bacterium]